MKLHELTGVVFVTGGSGFIGSAVVRKLLRDTEATVVNIDKLTYAASRSTGPIHSVDRYRFYQTDICESGAIEQLFYRYRPSAIIHLAAESHVDRSIEGPADFIQTNIVGTFVLLQAARSYFSRLSKVEKGRFRFLHVSTDEVFGSLGADGYFTEQTAYAPRSPYSASKASSDHLVRAWHETYGLPTIVTNCSNNFGPYQFPEKLIPHIIIKALSEQRLPVYGDGLQVRDWLFVEDHAEALLTVLARGTVGNTYNVGGNSERTNLAVVETVCALLDQLQPSTHGDRKRLITFVEDRPGHDRRYAIDASKIKHEVGWTPTTSFESGLASTVQWYLNHPNWWQEILDGGYNADRIGLRR